MRFIHDFLRESGFKSKSGRSHLKWYKDGKYRTCTSYGSKSEPWAKRIIEEAGLDWKDFQAFLGH